MLERGRLGQENHRIQEGLLANLLSTHLLVPVDPIQSMYRVTEPDSAVVVDVIVGADSVGDDGEVVGEAVGEAVGNASAAAAHKRVMVMAVRPVFQVLAMAMIGKGGCV